MTSGAIQYGVPTSDLRFGNSGITRAQKPKSESFTYKTIIKTQYKSIT